MNCIDEAQNYKHQLLVDWRTYASYQCLSHLKTFHIHVCTTAMRVGITGNLLRLDSSRKLNPINVWSKHFAE